MKSIATEKKLSKLKKELERLSLEHAAKMAGLDLAGNPRRLAAESRRAEMLARRIRQLVKMLEKAGTGR